MGMQRKRRKWVLREYKNENCWGSSAGGEY